MASELDELRWAVVSERGKEKTGLTYAAAAELMRKLHAEKVRSLGIVTDEAAARVTIRRNFPENSSNQ